MFRVLVVELEMAESPGDLDQPLVEGELGMLATAFLPEFLQDLVGLEILLAGEEVEPV